MAAKEIFELIENSINPDETARQIINQHPEVIEKVKRLKEIRNELEKENLIREVSIGKSSKLFGLLEGSGKELIYNKEDQSKNVLIEKSILEGYHLTSIILQELGFIDKVLYTFTYIDNKGNYHRAGDMELTLDAVKLEAASSKRGYVSLRLQESIIKQQIAAKTTEEVQIAINNHYQHFVQMYYDYENNNNTGWTVSNKRGILAEVFERHWENMHHMIDGDINQFNKNNIGNDLESKGKRWLMFRESSGNAPYYTGPDTLYSQVKNANASLIDNVNTVLNAMDAVIKLVDDSINIKNLAFKIKRAFSASESTAKFPRAIWDGLEEDVKQQIKEEIASMQGVEVEDINIKTNKKAVRFVSK